jgi:hypothetical protein
LTATGVCHPDGSTETITTKLRGMERIRELSVERDALQRRVRELLSDAQLRLQVATDAKPSNIRLGQARELYWWVSRLSSLAALSQPEGDG